MQQHNRPELEALTYDNLPNNTTGYIDPARLREVLLALIASFLNLLDDGNPGAGGGGTSPTQATFGNLGGQARDNASLLAYLASLGHPLTEYVPPMPVKAGYWYITSTGIWEAKSSFNGMAAPRTGSYWRLVAGFGGAGSGTSQLPTTVQLAANVFKCSPDLVALGVGPLVWQQPSGSTTPVAGQYNSTLLRVTNNPYDGSTLAYTDSTGATVPIPTNQPGPYIELALAATGPFLQGDPLVLPWREYAITGNWNGTGTDSTVYVAGLTNKRWASLGWVLDSNGEAQTVQVNVGAKTWGTLVAGTASPQQAVITALAAASFDVEVAPGMPLDVSRYRLRAIPKATGGGTTPPAPSPAPTGFTVDNQRQASFMLAAGTVAGDYEYELTEQA